MVIHKGLSCNVVCDAEKKKEGLNKKKRDKYNQQEQS